MIIKTILDVEGFLAPWTRYCYWLLNFTIFTSSSQFSSSIIFAISHFLFLNSLEEYFLMEWFSTTGTPSFVLPSQLSTCSSDHWEWAYLWTQWCPPNASIASLPFRWGSLNVVLHWTDAWINCIFLSLFLNCSLHLLHFTWDRWMRQAEWATTWQAVQRSLSPLLTITS